MHNSLNIWNGIGNIGSFFELDKSGRVPVLRFHLYIDHVEAYYGGPTGQTLKKIHTKERIPVAVIGNEAELNARALQKGSKICVTGSLRVRHNEMYVETDKVQWLDSIRNPNTTPALQEEAT